MIRSLTVTQMMANVSYSSIFVFCSAGEGSEEKDSDRILAFAISASGKHVALTDDHKRLVLFCTEPSWKCISTR